MPHESHGPPPDPARGRSCGGPNAGTWLIALPTSPAVRMWNEEYTCAVRRRLGLALNAISDNCEGCGTLLDPYGYHRCPCTCTSRNHTRHRSMLGAWRQVFQESGNTIPRRNVERLLRNTHVPVANQDSRRLDLIVANASIARGLPLFCDATIVSPLTGRGQARGGSLRIDGGALNAARRLNDCIYHEVPSSGGARLCALDCETYGRWGVDPLWIVPALARERACGLPPPTRRGIQYRLQLRFL